MRYSYEYKLRCVEMYRRGEWPETPEGIKHKHSFHNMIRKWTRIVADCGAEALRHKTQNRVWLPDERYKLVAQVLAGQSLTETAYRAGIGSGLLHKWVQKYKAEGYNGLVSLKPGRSPKEPTMEKVIEPRPLTESEREELIRLRAEIEYIKAENEVIKKEIALREEKQAALLKAKKQRLSRNSEKRDTN